MAFRLLTTHNRTQSSSSKPVVIVNGSEDEGDKLCWQERLEYMVQIVGFGGYAEMIILEYGRLECCIKPDKRAMA